MIAQELAKEVKFKYKFYMVPGGGYGSLKNGRSIIILTIRITINLIFIIVINAKCVLVKSRVQEMKCKNRPPMRIRSQPTIYFWGQYKTSSSDNSPDSFHFRDVMNAREHIVAKVKV